MPKIVYMETPWKGEIKLGNDIINELKRRKIKTLSLFASVQFLKLDVVLKQLSSIKIEVLTTKAKRANVFVQILGCDAYSHSFNANIIKESDVILYIGDGLFHPKALLLSQRESDIKKDVLIWDPVSRKMKALTIKTIQLEIKKTITNLKKFIASKTVGIIVSLKPGQEYMKIAKELKKTIEQQGKNVYMFIGNHISLDEFENFSFIDVWVNTACPRIGLDDQIHATKALINSREALDPIASLEKLQNQ